MGAKDIENRLDIDKVLFKCGRINDQFIKIDDQGEK